MPKSAQPLAIDCLQEYASFGLIEGRRPEYPIQMKPAVIPHSSRRQFVRTFVLGGASSVVGAPWIGTLLATLLGEGRAEAATDGELNLQLTSFPPLLDTSSSVRVSVDPLSGTFPAGDFYPLIISRGSGNDFYAVSSNCTHRGCVVLPFDGNSIACPCHGSEFAIDGSLLRGPADSDLLHYPIKFDGANTLKVTVPGLGYSITNFTVLTGATPRIRLEFPTFSQVNYEIRFRQSLSATWTVVPFATTLTGAADTMVLTGDGSTATVFVNRTTMTGFYSVAIQVKEV
jgi:Rieske Fe-S protein